IAPVPGGDSLWLADRLGLTLFLASSQKGDGLILDNYTRLGELARDIPVQRVAVDSGQVWAGTDNGLAVASRRDVRLLKAPSGWQTFFPSQIVTTLRSDTITGMAMVRDTLYLGTAQGVYRFEQSVEPAMTYLYTYGNPRVYNLSLTGDTVMAHTVRGSYYLDQGQFIGLPTAGMPISNTTAGVYDPQGVFWNGNLVEGIYYLDGQTLFRFDAGGMPGNRCLGIASAQGKIWGGFSGDGLAYYENGRWTKVNSVTGDVRGMAAGPLGELWVGTWGAGVYRILGDSIAHFDTTNSALSGVSEGLAYVVVTDFVSSGDAVWMNNYRGVNGEVVAVNPYQTDQWQAYQFIGGSYAEQISTITAGQGGVYAGSENNGIYAIGYSGTPFYTGDDYRWTFTSSSSGIGSDVIRRLRVDRFDTLWVGTAFGLSYQALGEIYFTNLSLPEGFGPEVTAFDFDGQGSLYAGSAQGLIVRDIATGAFTYLTSKNSGLVDDDIKDIHFDHSDNSVWIATSGGVSRLQMPYALASPDIEQVLAYPNPFVIQDGAETVRFNFAQTATIRIYTLAGELVREIPVTGSWDGRNAQGEVVASGVYIFTLTDPEGKVGRGKIFLVRK
ncbi:MAG: T9SS type A sorting domain-containing protein, partial [candidate division Zixibacteria bacterium]|nr:T9SS type A sorting domain-containing protein [candidate division Zixibacteria bacterium]